jgi:molecular chaperone IbpA
MTQFDIAKMFDIATLDKFFVGYEPMMKRMEEAHTSLSKAIPNYPPYNIVKVDENKYVIEMAVAGFGKSNLDIEIQDGTLVVSGQSQLADMYEEGINNTYLYKGIADRNFTRKFSIADTVEIKNADLINGMLKIWLENIIPDTKKPKKVEINDPASKEPTKTSNKQFLSENNKED